MKRVLLVGNPNTGKSTLMNALTGAGARVGNFAGTTVRSLRAEWMLEGVGSVELVDVPGTYSLAAHSPDERVAIEAVRGTGEAQADVVILTGNNFVLNLLARIRIRITGLISYVR